MSNKPLFIANLLRVARTDLDDARKLAATGSRNAIYLCEQAAEKIIRAVLESEDIVGGRTHDLSQMVDKLPDVNPLKPALRDIEDLAAYATAYRYPTSAGRIPGMPHTDEFNDLAGKVEAAMKNAAARFGVNLDDNNTPAARPGPLR